MTDDQPKPRTRPNLQLEDLTDAGLERLQQLLTDVCDHARALDGRKLRRRQAEAELRRFLTDWPRRTA